MNQWRGQDQGGIGPRRIAADPAPRAARDLSDGAAWRVVAVGNATGWAISGAVAAIALASGLGSSVAWVIVALQLVMTIAWLSVFARSRRSGLATSRWPD